MTTNQKRLIVLVILAIAFILTACDTGEPGCNSPACANHQCAMCQQP